MKIEDGTGSGKLVKVDSKNRIEASSVIKTAEHEANFGEGKSWSIVVQQTPTATACSGS